MDEKTDLKSKLNELKEQSYLSQVFFFLNYLNHFFIITLNNIQVKPERFDGRDEKDKIQKAL